MPNNYPPPLPPAQYQQEPNGYSKNVSYQPVKCVEALMDMSQQQPQQQDNSKNNAGEKTD